MNLNMISGNSFTSNNGNTVIHGIIATDIKSQPLENKKTDGCTIKL